MVQPPLLTDLSLDLHVHLCEFLHPSQILALRKTCKDFYEATSRRIVWIHALIRICHANRLFLPTFPIADMSNAELERAAMAPLRWLAVSTMGDGVLPQTRPTLIINKPIPYMLDVLHPEDKVEWDPARFWIEQTYLVPGGRYLVVSGIEWDCLGVWDLGYVSESDRDHVPTDYEDYELSNILWVTLVKKPEKFTCHPTPDGLGIRILTCSEPLPYVFYGVFEIYPQKPTPNLVKIAEFILDPQAGQLVKGSLNGNRAVIHGRKNGIVIVWDFIANTVASWSISDPSPTDEVIKFTETAIIILQTGSANPFLSIFEIPPLTPKTSPFDTEMAYPRLAPVLTFKYPEAVLSWCHKPMDWYYDDLSLPLYFDVLKSRETRDFVRCKLDIARDLSDVSLIPITNVTMKYPLDYLKESHFILCWFCEDELVNLFPCFDEVVNTGFNLISSGTGVGFALSSDSPPPLRANLTHLGTNFTYSTGSFCPASARFVYTDGEDIDIVDFLYT